MRTAWLFAAAFIGWIADIFLTSLLVPLLDLAFKIDPSYFNVADSRFWVAHIIIPILCTTIGGGLAGRIAPDSAAPSGALVGGMGIFQLLFDTIDVPNSLPREQLQTFVLAQIGATALAIIAAILIARRYLSRVES